MGYIVYTSDNKKLDSGVYGARSAKLIRAKNAITDGFSGDVIGKPE